MASKVLFAWLIGAAILLAPNPSSASAKFGALLDRADAMRSADPAEFLVALGQLDAAVSQADEEQLLRLRYLHTYRMALEGDYAAAIKDLQKILDETDNTQLKFRTAAFLANNHAATQKFTEGLGYLDVMLSMLPMISDKNVRHQGLTTAAIIYNQVGQHDLAQQYSEMILGEDANGRAACQAGYTRLEALFNLNNLPADDGEFNRVIAQCMDSREALVAGFIRTYLARKLMTEGRRGDAIAALLDNLRRAEEIRYPRLLTEVHALLAELYAESGDAALAQQHAAHAVEIGASIAFSIPVVNAHRIQYEIALRNGDLALALDQYRKYSAADKAYLDDVKAREMAFQIVRHETQQKIQTIELLNKRNQVLQLEQKVAAQSARNTQLLIALLVVLLASIAYWAYKVKRLQVSLRRLAETDALTGISNRHHFSRRAEAALEYCQRAGEPAALVMFDLDEFKSINDVHGHAMGDWVLQQVAAVCTASCRKNDLFGRLGGEEFAFLLLGADVAAGLQLARECRERISAIDTGSTGARFRVTASFGVAASANVGYNFQALLARADEAMYRAKREGRDRISLHTPDIVASSATV